jgi:hypothetical protein
MAKRAPKGLFLWITIRGRDGAPRPLPRSSGQERPRDETYPPFAPTVVSAVRIDIACDSQPREGNGLTHSLRILSGPQPLRRKEALSSFLMYPGKCPIVALARIMHEPPAATADMLVLPGVLASRTLRRTEKYASGPSPCGCAVARPSPRSRDGVSWIMRARGTDPAPESSSTLLRPRWFSSIPPGAGRRISAPKTLDSLYPTGT